MCLSIQLLPLELSKCILLGSAVVFIIFLVLYPENSYARILTAKGKSIRQRSYMLATFLLVPTVFAAIPTLFKVSRELETACILAVLACFVGACLLSYYSRRHALEKFVDGAGEED